MSFKYNKGWGFDLRNQCLLYIWIIFSIKVIVWNICLWRWFSIALVFSTSIYLWLNDNKFSIGKYDKVMRISSVNGLLTLLLVEAHFIRSIANHKCMLRVNFEYWQGPHTWLLLNAERTLCSAPPSSCEPLSGVQAQKVLRTYLRWVWTHFQSRCNEWTHSLQPGMML